MHLEYYYYYYYYYLYINIYIISFLFVYLLFMCFILFYFLLCTVRFVCVDINLSGLGHAPSVVAARLSAGGPDGQRQPLRVPRGRFRAHGLCQEGRAAPRRPVSPLERRGRREDRGPRER